MLIQATILVIFNSAYACYPEIAKSGKLDTIKSSLRSKGVLAINKHSITFKLSNGKSSSWQAKGSGPDGTQKKYAFKGLDRSGCYALVQRIINDSAIKDYIINLENGKHMIYDGHFAQSPDTKHILLVIYKDGDLFMTLFQANKEGLRQVLERRIGLPLMDQDHDRVDWKYLYLSRPKTFSMSAIRFVRNKGNKDWEVELLASTHPQYEYKTQTDKETEGNFQSNIQQAKESIKIHGKGSGNQARLYQIQSEYYAHRKEYKRAIRYAKKSIRSYDTAKLFGSKTGRVNLARIYIKMKKYKKAIRIYETFISDHTKKYDQAYKGNNYNEIAKIYKMDGQYLKAIESYNTAAAIFNSKNKKPMQKNYKSREIGLVLLDKKDYALAMSNFKWALQFDKDKFGIEDVEVMIDYYYIALTHKKLGSDKQAAKLYKKAIATGKLNSLWAPDIVKIDIFKTNK